MPYPELDPEPEITSGPVPLCDADGNLNPDAVGWSRFPLHECAIPGRWPRKKKWNYWCIVGPDYLFSMTISHLDFAAIAFVYALDFATNEFVELSMLNPLGLGHRMPEGTEGDLECKGCINALMRTEGATTRLTINCPKFGDGALIGEVIVTTPPNHESLNVVIPWDRRTFQFTSKQHSLPVSGTIQWGDRKMSFQPDDSFACLDFGRGVWPRRCTWNWGGGSGRMGNHIVGLNLGGKWTDGTGMTENGMIVDGRLTKISEYLRFDYDDHEFMTPWTIRTVHTKQVDLTFTPFYERVAKSNVWLVKSEVHQLIGRYEGTVVTESGEVIRIENLIGWAEEHEALW